MLTFSRAREVAEAWVSATTHEEGELLRDQTTAKPYGWLFFYQSKDFVRDPSNVSAAYAGNGPFLVRRADGHVHVFGTSTPIEAQLAEYERHLSQSEMSIPSEPAKWERHDG